MVMNISIIFMSSVALFCPEIVTTDDKNVVFFSVSGLVNRVRRSK